MGPGVRAIMTTLRPSRVVSPKVPSSRWNANTTSQAPSVGDEVSGAAGEKRQGQVTVQLQFSKYSPRRDHAGAAVSAMNTSLPRAIDPVRTSQSDRQRISRHVVVKTAGERPSHHPPHPDSSMPAIYPRET